MIRSDPPRPEAFRIRAASAPALHFTDGETVRVEVTGPASGEGTPIRIAGVPLVARSFSSSLPGDVFSARVTVAEGTVFLQPSYADSPQSAGAAARLGLPETPVTATLIGFFTAINARLDPRALSSLSRLAARFTGKETRAAEAAAILAERGIEPDDETVGSLIACIDGEPSGDRDDGGRDYHGKNRKHSEHSEHGDEASGKGTDPDSSRAEESRSARFRDLAAFVNHKKGHDLHWIVIPFTRGEGASSYGGSVRLLLDTLERTVTEIRIVASAGAHRWEFTLSGESCVFSAEPPFDAVKTAKMSVYLKQILEEAGCSGILFAAPGADRNSLIKGVDLKI